jgi:2,3-diaminopropionate biosynthesis protein SbnA
MIGMAPVFCTKINDILHDDVFLFMGGFASDCLVWVKLEGYDAAGSIKLKTAVWLVDNIEARGLLGPGSRIIESSSGNLGIALSLVCAERGYGFTCVCDPNALPGNLRLIEAYGGEVVVVDRQDENGGYLGTRIAFVRKRLAEDYNLVWTNQYANQAGADVHRRLTARAVLRVVPDLDYLFVGVGTGGTGGTVMGCQAYLGEMDSRVQLVGVDVEGSVTFGRPAGCRHIPGLGTCARPELFAPARIQQVVVSEGDTIRIAREVLTRWRLLAGGSTSSVLAGVRKIAPSMPADAKIVAISPDFGESYMASIYDDSWVERRFPDFRPERLDDTATSTHPMTVSAS